MDMFGYTEARMDVPRSLSKGRIQHGERDMVCIGMSTAEVKHLFRYVDYAMHRVRLLKHHNITPYVVFDGGPLPAKIGTESTRHQSREKNRVKALSLDKEGKHSEARECFTKAVDVTPEMAYQLIKVSPMSLECAHSLMF
jgi:5'-3' exonuclease